MGGQLEGAVVAKLCSLGLAGQGVVVVVIGGAQQVAQVLGFQCMVRVLGEDFAIVDVDAIHADGLEPLVGAIGHHHGDAQLFEGLRQHL